MPVVDSSGRRSRQSGRAPSRSCGLLKTKKLQRQKIKRLVRARAKSTKNHGLLKTGRNQRQKRACTGPGTHQGLLRAAEATPGSEVQGACTEPRTAGSKGPCRKRSCSAMSCAPSSHQTQLEGCKTGAHIGRRTRSLKAKFTSSYCVSTERLGRVEPIGGSATKLNLVDSM